MSSLGGVLYNNDDLIGNGFSVGSGTVASFLTTKTRLSMGSVADIDPDFYDVVDIGSLSCPVSGFVDIGELSDVMCD